MVSRWLRKSPRAMLNLATIALAGALPIGSALPAGEPLIKACAAPALPAPAGNVVRVSTEPQLQDAIASLSSDTTILIAPGTYALTSTLWVGRSVQNVAIRGDSSRCDEVVLVGRGMTNSSFGNVPHGIWIGAAQNVLVANLTIRDVYYHPIQLDPGEGARAPRIYNCRLVDAGQQFIKSSDNANGAGVAAGIVEYCTLEYTTHAPTNYTNGVDVHEGSDWIVRHNVFRNIRAPAGQLAGPAVLMWNRTRNSIVEGNLFLNVQYGIALGLNAAVADDHTGGIVRNNFFHRSASQSGDVAIVVNNCAGAKVLHNTVILSGTYPNAIEYRFAPTTGTEIRYNLSDSRIQARDGASGTVAGNVTNAQGSWFVDVASGDLHLAETATSAIDKAAAHPDVGSDYDSQSRTAQGAPDVGADERAAVSPDTTPPATPENLRVR